MTLACAAPDPSIGVAIRFASYADCQARALGENGFQALIGSPILTGLTSALVTIFVALVGYHLILGQPITLADGITRMVRLGMVLTLTASWPAFQTVVFDVVADGPSELAATVLPSVQLSDQGLSERVQLAYDTMRLGVVEASEASSQPSQPGSPPPIGAQSGVPALGNQATASARSPSGMLPQTASILVISTLGVSGALRIASGLLLAIAPLAMLALLFDATLGLFSGWLRALAGATLALLASTVVTALELVMVEGELGAQQAYGRGGLVTTIDPQALTTLTLLFAVVMLVAVILAARMAGAISLRWRVPATLAAPVSPSLIGSGEFASGHETRWNGSAQLVEQRSRAMALADRLQVVAAREGAVSVINSRSGLGELPRRNSNLAEGLIASTGQHAAARGRGRVGLGRASRRASARDKVS